MGALIYCNVCGLWDLDMKFLIENLTDGELNFLCPVC